MLEYSVEGSMQHIFKEGVDATAMSEWSEDETSFMTRALEIAERGRTKVSPNPLVGCVLVKDGNIIAEGWHDHLGGLHAEQMAIHDAEERGISPNGSTAYVTLEPCNHFGRTPPCTEALMWAGIKEVVIAHEDPNPTVRGKGSQTLTDAGIKVRTGLCKQEAHEQMLPFMHWCEHRRPLVTVKLAQNLEGSVDDRSGTSKRFTSEECLRHVHELRADVDAILVGANTVLRDDPQLTVRGINVKSQPLRIVIDPNGKCPPNAKFTQQQGDFLHLTTSFTSLESLLHMLADQNIQRLLVEGGPTTIQEFLKHGFVDEFFLVQSEVMHSEPYLSNIDSSVLESYGLRCVGRLQWGGEEVLHYRSSM
jgi:diaminohydroxyphosphoribosylaminopyrimidine deaminase/5-amino-6-(5-phosphoribosylamino)uracil reductase